VLSGLRPYGLDILHGLVIGPGNVTGNYDANGSYSRFLGMASTPESFAGLSSLLPAPTFPGLPGVRQGRTDRCPGGAADPPPPDGSAPYVPPGTTCGRGLRP
jgi:hypothetical protein